MLLSRSPKKRRFRSTTALALFGLLVLVLPLVASGAPSVWGVQIRQTTINANNSVTIRWAFQNEDVYNDSIDIDGREVKYWPGLNQSQTYTTRHLDPGRHRITVNVVEIFHTNTYYSSANCDVSSSDYYIWICSWDWQSSKMVNIPSAPRNASCVVPSVTGLLLADARARIKSAHCAVGTVTRVDSVRGSGTVLSQRPKAGRKLPKGAVVDLTVSQGQTTVPAQPTFSITGRRGLTNGQPTIVLRVTARRGGEALLNYGLCWQTLNGDQCTDPTRGVGTYVTADGMYWVEYEIPITSTVTVNGQFSAWVTYQGKRVATYTTPF